jgi:hypothetical protein
MYKTPTNKQEYWENVFAHWEDIIHILNVYLPTFGKRWIDSTPLDKTLGEHIIELKESRNPKLVRAFNAAWFKCPYDNAGEWAHSSWDFFYNLCLDECFLYEEKELEDE